MATKEMIPDGTEGDQRENMLPPSEDVCSPFLKDNSASLNFPGLTPSQFGISVQSFTPSSSSSNRKEKSRLAQLKARRRSSVGVRGSPETNSLIRFMAQQKMKTQSHHKTSELVRSSPFLPLVASTRRQKMASFQSLMDVEENEVCDPMPRQDINTGGCIKTRDNLSDGKNLDGGKENNAPMWTPVPSKRRRVGPLEDCEVEIREASTPTLHFNLKEQEQENKESVTPAVTKRPPPSSVTVEEAQAELISPPLPVDFELPVSSELQAHSPSNNQQDSFFELRNPSQALPDDLAAASPAFHIPSLSSLQEMKPKGEDDYSSTSAAKNWKQVHFGGPLSPEFFDKFLPPSTPLQKGGTPARAPTPGGSLKLRSVLKTPQRSERLDAQPRPDLNSPDGFGASPKLAMPRNRRLQCMREDVAEEDRKIIFPSMEEIDSAVTSSTDSVTKLSPTTQMEALDELVSLPEKEKQPQAVVEAPTRSSSRKKKQGPVGPTIKAPARSGSQKRKLPEDSEPLKRSTRSAAKAASGKMKMTSTAKSQWNKEVNRSLYSSREYASKNPTLSPITESLSSITQSPASQQTPFTCCPARNQKPHLTQELEFVSNDTMTEGTQEISIITATSASESPSEASVTSPDSSKEMATGKDEWLSGTCDRPSGLTGRKVGVSDADPLSGEGENGSGETTDEKPEDRTTTHPVVSTEMPWKHTLPEEEGVDAEQHHASTSADGANSASPPSNEEDNPNVPAKSAQRIHKRARVTSRGRKGSVNQTEEHQMSHDVEEMGQRDQAASQQENNNLLSSDRQEEVGEAGSDLAPWQADFNFEDVFKPVATRGQRSVRRSLRNQINAGDNRNSTGLAWLSRTSPEFSRETSRRTRSTRTRRLGAALPVQPELLGETQHVTS